MQKKQLPLYERLYRDPTYYELARAVGYAGCTVRQLFEKIDALAKTLDKRKLESASTYLVSYQGQFTCNPKPLDHVSLRSDVRRLCHQLLGPDPMIPETNIVAAILKPKPQAKASVADPPPDDGKRKRTRKKAS